MLHLFLKFSLFTIHLLQRNSQHIQKYTLLRTYKYSKNYFKKLHIMKNEKPIKVITRFKAQEILECHHQDFYSKYFKRLKKHTFFGKDKRQRLYPLDMVMEIKAELDKERKFVIVD